MDYDNIIKKHNMYKKHIYRWRYYYDSYYGGQDYQQGQYLRKYLQEEDDGYNEYGKRIMNTPLDNHCRSVVDTYSSFIWRDSPQREFGSLADNPALQPFLKDADLEGRSFDAVMREATTLANIYGHVLLMLDKPASEAATLAEELSQGIRPYLSVITPENIIDWNFTRAANGRYMLDYLKLKEFEDDNVCVYRVWENDKVTVFEVNEDDSDYKLVEQYDNQMGHIPAVFLYGQRSHERGIGISQIADVADVQKSIYNELSELEQVIRISNHPSIVATEGVDMMGGAGSVITIENTDMDPGLKPYLLQANSQSISSILESLKTKTAMIDRMANLSAMRSTSKATASGVSLKIERELLNVKLAQIADNLEIAEEQIWHHFLHFYDLEGHFDGVIDYPDNFDMTDTYTELDFLMKASAAPVSSSQYSTEIAKQIARITIEDEEMMDTIIKEIENGSQAPEFGANLDGDTNTNTES
jgi:hypothetical protein